MLPTFAAATFLIGCLASPLAAQAVDLALETKQNDTQVVARLQPGSDGLAVVLASLHDKTDVLVPGLPPILSSMTAVELRRVTPHTLFSFRRLQLDYYVQLGLISDDLFAGRIGVSRPLQVPALDDEHQQPATASR